MSIGTLAKRLGVTVRTLQNWDNSGKLKAHRTLTNRRYYTESDYLRATRQPLPRKRLNVIYARVSSYGQKDDLKSQVKFLRNYVNAKGVITDKVITDIGSGMNYKRKKWNKLLDAVMESKIKCIYIAYPDRFIRFGFPWFQHFCSKFNTKIVVVRNKTMSPEAEVVSDLISIIHVFSCRVYGLRKYKTKVKNDRTIQKEVK